MARSWAYILKETGYSDSASVKGPSGYAAIAGTQTADGVKNTDFIIPDLENQALNISDTNNSYPIASYASFGGTRLCEVVGYQVGGTWSTKLYDEQAPFLLDLAIRKRNATTNPTGDLPSFRVDQCYYDSDFTPHLIGNKYTGLKVGQFGMTAGASSPYVQCVAQLVGSRVSEIPVNATTQVPSYAAEPACDSYPVAPYTFRHMSLYIDFDGNALFPNKTGHWDVDAIAAKKVKVLRSVSLNFANQIATSSHTDGVVERAIRTMVNPSFSVVADMMDPGTPTTEAPKSRTWQTKYRSMRNNATSGYFSVAIVLDNGTSQIIFDLGKQAVVMGYQPITPISEIFAVQISGSSMFDPALCGTFDWVIQPKATS
ncbi:hypothetical protein UFOVP142_37 [uncultured Caudovirales phage]|uniref:Uncharacterized protein n=1 Tax=uncultured Caudovirales phage TaxID=2100421 RepID=A0A6J7XUF0_9CAUD|nr:hypothetical protein UFOVP142_37 [uncultured Caudovirales phage]